MSIQVASPAISQTRHEAVTGKDEDVVSIRQPSDPSLGNIVFNGTLLRSHRMAGCFMTVTPDNDGYLNMPDNLKVDQTLNDIVYMFRALN